MAIPTIFKRRAWNGRVVHYFITLHLGVDNTLCGRKLVPHDGDAWYTIGYPECGECVDRYAKLKRENEQATAGDLSGGSDAA